jgi:hypothetical protein
MSGPCDLFGSISSCLCVDQSPNVSCESYAYGLNFKSQSRERVVSCRARTGQRVTGVACGDRKHINPLAFIFGVLHSAPRVPCGLLGFLWLRTRLVSHAPKSFVFLFRLSSQQQNVIDAGDRSTSHGTSVRVRSRGGPGAADVRASLWLESQLLLQIPATDGRADGDPDDNDRAVSDRIVYGDGRPTEALEAVLSARLVFFRGLLTQRLQSERSDLFRLDFCDSLSRSIRACAGLNRVRVLVGRIGNPELNGRRVRNSKNRAMKMFLVSIFSKCSSLCLRPFGLDLWTLWIYALSL